MGIKSSPKSLLALVILITPLLVEGARSLSLAIAAPKTPTASPSSPPFNTTNVEKIQQENNNELREINKSFQITFNKLSDFYILLTINAIAVIIITISTVLFLITLITRVAEKASSTKALEAKSKPLDLEIEPEPILDKRLSDSDPKNTPDEVLPNHIHNESKREIIEISQDSDSKDINPLATILSEINSNISGLRSDLKIIIDQSNGVEEKEDTETISDVNNLEQEAPPFGGLSLPVFISEIVQLYNDNPEKLSKTSVSLTQNSMQNLRLGALEPPEFEKADRGVYWAVSQDSKDYLVPQKHINKHLLQNIKSSFEFKNFKEQYTEFKLIEPAHLSPLSQGEAWILEKKGILDFT